MKRRQRPRTSITNNECPPSSPQRKYTHRTSLRNKPKRITRHHRSLPTRRSDQRVFSLFKGMTSNRRHRVNRSHFQKILRFTSSLIRPNRSLNQYRQPNKRNSRMLTRRITRIISRKTIRNPRVRQRRSPRVIRKYSLLYRMTPRHIYRCQRRGIISNRPHKPTSNLRL